MMIRRLGQLEESVSLASHKADRVGHLLRLRHLSGATGRPASRYQIGALGWPAQVRQPPPQPPLTSGARPSGRSACCCCCCCCCATATATASKPLEARPSPINATPTTRAGQTGAQRVAPSRLSLRRLLFARPSDWSRSNANRITQRLPACKPKLGRPILKRDRLNLEAAQRCVQVLHITAASTATTSINQTFCPAPTRAGQTTTHGLGKQAKPKNQ